MANIKYRPDVDGLRAIAVLFVIIFHFNKDILPGGFIGVDIFFVISGFIITLAIFPQMKMGKFSFSDFYEKRIKRILPLFYLVAATSLVCAYFLFSPNDFSSFADSLRYSSVFISNIYFEKSTGYFAPSSETMPLLHIWSLSVEEQFYFLWPIVLLVCIRYLPSKLSRVLLVLGLGTLIGVSQWLAINDPSGAYFWIQSRAFEMLIGAATALLIICLRERDTTLRKNLYTFAGIFGAAMVAGALITLDKGKVFPGINAAIVCFGAAFVIFSGENKDSIVSKFLSFPVFVWLGKLSYSLYLWHWPVQAFYRYYEPTFGLRGFIVCSVVTFVLSLLSFKLVENPARHIGLKKKYVFIGYFLIPVVAFVLIAKNIAKNEGYPERFSPQAMALYYDSVSNIETEKGSRKEMTGYEPFYPMLLGDQSVTVPTVLLWGDSHAQHFQPFVDELGKKYHFGALYAGQGGCPPIAEGGRVRYGELEEHCYKTNERALKEILKSDAKIVLLGGRWATYTETTLAKNEEGRNIYLGDALDRTESLENNRRVFDKGFEKTIAELVEHGKTPVVFGQVPSYSFKPSNCLVKKANYHWMVGSSCDEDYEPFKERYGYFNEMLHQLKKKYPQLVVIDVPSVLCSGDKCVSAIDGRPIYKDNNHINEVGSRKIYEAYMASDSSKALKALFAS